VEHYPFSLFSEAGKNTCCTCGEVCAHYYFFNPFTLAVPEIHVFTRKIFSTEVIVSSSVVDSKYIIPVYKNCSYEQINDTTHQITSDLIAI